MSPTIPRPGGRLGPFRLFDRLGQGGMGVVFHARHEASGQEVALKTLRRIDRGAMGALRREIRTLAGLDHPGIVDVVDHGVTDDGLPWIALAWLRGRELHAHLTHRAELALVEHPTAATATLDETAADVSLFADTPLHAFDDTALPDTGDAGATQTPVAPVAQRPRTPLREILEPLVQVALTLAWLHGEGVVHRDIKPGNIVVEPDGRAVLVDFGIAATAPGATLREQFTADVLGIGTPTYMAPEQIAAHHVDARADLYALGVMLYEFLAGRPPFLGSVSEVARAHVEDTPPPLDTLAPDLPADLLDLVGDLLERAPAQRPGYALDVACRMAALCGLPSSPEALLAHYDAPPPRAAHLYRAELTGRDELLAVFDEALHAVAAGHGVLVLVEGDAGLGRTRLLIELTERLAARTRQATSRPRLLRARCREGVGAGQPMLGALLTALEPVIDGCRQDLAVRDRLFGSEGSLLATVSRSVAELGYTPAPVDADPAAQRARVVAALHTVLTRIAGRSGLVVMLDDVHAADPWTVAWLEGAAARGDAPILVLATARTESRPDWFVALGARPATVRHTLAPLSDDSLRSVVRSMLGLVTEVPGSWVETLARRAAGNPWYVAEYLRMAVQHGTITRSVDGLWQLADDGPGLAFDEHTPRAVYELMEACFAQLHPPSKTLVAVLVLHGADIALELLESIADPAVMAGLDDALHRAVLELDAHGHVSLRNGQLRPVVLDQLGEENKRAIHLQIAGALQHVGGESAHLAERGHHWAHAGHPEAAWPCFYSAALQAQTRGEFEATRDLFRAAVVFHAHAGGELVWRLRMERLLAGIEFGLSEHDTALTRYADVIERAARHGEHEEQLHALLAMASCEQVLGRARAVDEALEAAGVLLEAHDDPLVAVQLLGMQLNQAAMAGRTDEVERLGPALLARQRALGWHAAEAVTLSTLGDTAFFQRGALDEAHDWYTQSIAAFARCDELNNEATTLSNFGQLELQRGNTARAGELLARSLEMHQASGHVRGAGQALAALGSWHQVRGDLEAARSAFEEALHIARDCGDPQGVARRLNQLASLDLEQGHTLSALEQAEEAYALAREHLPWTDVLLIGRGLARARLHDARVPGALALYEQLLDEARRIGCGAPLEARLLQECCSIGRVVGVLDRVAGWLDRLDELAGRGQLPPLHQAGLHCHRLLYLLACDPLDLDAAEAQMSRLEACVREADLDDDELASHGLRVARAALEQAHTAPERLVRGTAPSSLMDGVRRWLRSTGVRVDGAPD